MSSDSDDAERLRERLREQVSLIFDVPEELLHSSHDDGCDCFPSVEIDKNGRPHTKR